VHVRFRAGCGSFAAPGWELRCARLWEIASGAASRVRTYWAHK
jgi:hypothetical protein